MISSQPQGSKPIWRKPSYGQKALTADEAFVARTLGFRGGLTCSRTRKEDVNAAESNYASTRCGWWTLHGEELYEDALKDLVAETRKFCNHGMPRRWPVKLDRFWYWVALRQQYEY